MTIDSELVADEGLIDPELEGLINPDLLCQPICWFRGWQSKQEMIKNIRTLSSVLKELLVK